MFYFEQINCSFSKSDCQRIYPIINSWQLVFSKQCFGFFLFCHRYPSVSAALILSWLYFEGCFNCKPNYFFYFIDATDFMFNSRATKVFGNDLRKRFLSSSPSIRSSNSSLTLLLKAFIASKALSVVSLLSLSSLRCSFNLLVIS